METVKQSFRKKMIGGFNEDDVIAYIGKLGEQLERSEKEASELRSRVEELTALHNEDTAKIEKLSSELKNNESALRDEFIGEIDAAEKISAMMSAVLDNMRKLTKETETENG